MRRSWDIGSWLVIVAVYAVLILMATACSCNGGIRNMSDSWCDAKEAQSWDQANLKRHDIGCPTAIFVAPGGNLEQCE